ncbi:MAG: glycerol kinase GlpK [Acidiferrobacterales bacterium]|nr:glycerol kinase GlpK [Acidiferrobacterales bacterium]
MSGFILSIDQGTTSSRTILFDHLGNNVCSSQYEFAQHYPADGWVEHDPEDIWKTTLTSWLDVQKEAGGKADEIQGIGITNQRETTVVWERSTGTPIYSAIVWQDRRTAETCEEIVALGHAETIASKTGLLIDAYFSATKISWILDNIDGARQRAERGELAFGTIDSFLIWRMTNGEVHATDATNASRTLLFNIHTQQWDETLLKIFDVPRSLLPEVKDCADDYGSTDEKIFGRSLPIAGVAGDQQAALVGQACFSPGMLKSTYGTGCFMVMNTGSEPVTSENQLLATVGYRINGKVTYALEGSIFNAGTAIQWLRDDLKLISDVSEIDSLVHDTWNNGGVYMVPAFTGLGAPHWDPHARGAITGITRDTSAGHFVRAALEAVCYQSRELVMAMSSDSNHTTTHLRVDGGMAANDWMLQFLSDITNTTVEKPQIIETTALGAAYIAGLQLGVYQSLDEISDLWRNTHTYVPEIESDHRHSLVKGWEAAINSVKSSAN